jgi:hypothetical protein
MNPYPLVGLTTSPCREPFQVLHCVSTIAGIAARNTSPIERVRENQTISGRFVGPMFQCLRSVGALRWTRLGRGIFAFTTNVRTQLAFEDIALVGFGFTFDAISQVERLLFLRHLSHNFIKTGGLLADGRVLNRLANKKLERHQSPFVLAHAIRQLLERPAACYCAASP